MKLLETVVTKKNEAPKNNLKFNTLKYPKIIAIEFSDFHLNLKSPS